MDVLQAIESSGLGTWVRASGSAWSYPLIITFHAWGLALVVGLNAAIDLRVLGFAPGVPVTPMAKLFPLIYLGFWMNAISGVILTIANATTMIPNPLFLLKLTAIGLAVANMVFLKREVFHRRAPAGLVSGTGQLLAATSLVLWTGAIVAGRLTAYLDANGIK